MSDTYKEEVKVLNFPGMTARVHFPDLTQEERKRRLQNIHDRAAVILKERK